MPAAGADEEAESELRALWARTAADYVALCAGFQFHTGLERVFTFVKAINAYIEKRAPWKLGKSAEPADQARLRTALATMAEALRLAATALRPVMPATSDQIHSVLGAAAGPDWRADLAWGGGWRATRQPPAWCCFRGRNEDGGTRGFREPDARGAPRVPGAMQGGGGPRGAAAAREHFPGGGRP